MTSPIIIRVPAVPVAQPRQRHRLVKTGSGKEFIQNYSPAKHPVTTFKATVRHAFHEAYKGPPLTGPLRCDCLFVMPRTSDLIWKTRPMPRLPHAKKPDRDNLDKAVMDALKGLAWIDDSQVCQGTIEKCIAAGNEQPHAVITITQVEVITASAAVQELFPVEPEREEIPFS
jgi:Holliday junction resolvase RusA-like endonuclease